MHCRLQLQTGDAQTDDGWNEKQAATAALFRTQSAPMRHQSSHKIAPASPSRQELQEFEQLLDGTNVHMPTHLQVASGTSRYRHLSVHALCLGCELSSTGTQCPHPTHLPVASGTLPRYRQQWSVCALPFSCNMSSNNPSVEHAAGCHG